LSFLIIKKKNDFVKFCFLLKSKEKRGSLLRISYLEVEQIKEILDSKLAIQIPQIKKQLNLFDFL